MSYMNSLLTKLQFTEEMIKIFPDNRGYKDSLEIINRMIVLSRRLEQLRYAIVQFVALLQVYNQNLSDEENLYETNYEYGIYLSYIIVEFSILFNLDTTDMNSDYPRKLFNSANTFLKNYYTDGKFCINNGAITFDPTNFRKAYLQYKDRLKIEKSNFAKIKSIRDEYSAHHDINFNIDSFNFDSIINSFVALENVWMNLALSMGVVINSTKFKLDEYKTTFENINQIIQERFLALKKQYTKKENTL